MKQPKTTLVKLDIPKNKRILVTSDVHGNLKYLEKVLEKANFCDDDILIIVGDIVEKGTESLPISLKTRKNRNKLFSRLILLFLLI